MRPVVPVGEPVCLRSRHTGKIMRNKQPGARCEAASCADSTDEVLLEWMDDGTYIIQSVKDGKNLQCDPRSGACRFANHNKGGWERWKLEVRGGDVFFVSHIGKACLFYTFDAADDLPRVVCACPGPC